MNALGNFSGDYCKSSLLQLFWEQTEVVASLASLCITTEVNFKMNKGS